MARSSWIACGAPEGSDRPQDQEARAERANGSSAVLRIVFFGTPEFAVPTLRQTARLPAIRSSASSRSPIAPAAGASTCRTRRSRRSRRPAACPSCSRSAFGSLRSSTRFASWQPDLGVVAAYGKLIPEEILALPRHGMINVHASLLPKYRGAAPVHRAVIDGEAETGVTIMRVEKMLDSGPMLAKVKRPIGPDETSDVVERDLAELGAGLLVTVVDQIAAGTHQEELQDFMLCSYAPRLTKEEGLIDWTLPASYIHNRVRGLYPWPHAYTYLERRRA